MTQIDEQILRDIFNGNGLNYSQIVGDELTTVSMGLQDFNYSLKQVLALIATQVREARIKEAEYYLRNAAELSLKRTVGVNVIKDRIATLKGDDK